MEIVMMNTTNLKTYDNNPRINEPSVDAVVESIKQFKFRNPILIDRNNVIIAGHTRLEASKRLGLEEVPCIVIDDLTDEEVRAYRLVDNKTSELSMWDFEKLEQELESINLDMGLFGFDSNEETSIEVVEDDFEPIVPTNPFAKKGDIFVLGKHRVMCGDATNEADVMRLMNGKVADMIFTDPPYNVDYEGSNGLKLQNDNQSDYEFRSFLTKAFKNLFNNIKLGGSIYCCHADTEGLNFRTAFINSDFKLAECLIWVKNSLVLGRQDYHWRHEPILYGWKEGASHYFIDDRSQDTVWEFNKPRSNDLHPTMKPIELVTKAIINSSRKGELVLDLFGGSGTTLLASEQVNRTAYLLEIDERYVDVIVNRYVNFKGNENCYVIRGSDIIPIKDIVEYTVERT